MERNGRDALAGFLVADEPLVPGGAVSLGDYLMFAGYLASLVTPVAQLTGLSGSFQQAAVASQRAF